MNQERLEKLLKILVSLPRETETVEFKENSYNSQDIGKRISALSNSANLYDKKQSFLVFGVQDNTHNIVGTTFLPSNEKVGNEQLEFWLSKLINPRIDFRIYEFEYEFKKIVIFQIPPAINQPVKFLNIPYIRVGSATPKLINYPEKERKIWININKNSFEKGISRESLTISEVLNLLDYSKYFSLTKQEPPSKTEQFVEKMAQHGLVKKVFDNNYDIHNNPNRLKEQEIFSGYAISFEPLLDYINDKLPSNEEISKSLRKEAKMYPEVAIREFVANALIHQDLSISGAGPMIEIFDNRIEITNTGEPLIDTERFIDHPPCSRNEDMASLMRQIGVCEEGGTGIDRALINVALYQLPAPSFEKYDNFTKITLYARKSLRDMTLDDKVRACFQHCVLKYVEKSRMTNATLRERLGIGEKNYPTASVIIRSTIEKKLIKPSEKAKEYVPIWA